MTPAERLSRVAETDSSFRRVGPNWVGKCQTSTGRAPLISPGKHRGRPRGGIHYRDRPSRNACNAMGAIGEAGDVQSIQPWPELPETIRVEHRRGPWLKQVDYDFRRDNRHEQHAFLY